MIRVALRERGVELLWRGLTFLFGSSAVALVGLSWILMPTAEPSAFERKRQSADTLLLYELKPGESVRFASRAGQQIFYVVSHLLLPPTQSYDPEADFDYSIVATFEDKAGKTVAEHVFAERSRQSKAEPVGGDWLQENAFLTPGEGQLTDDRVTMIGVGTLLPDGGHVSLSTKDTRAPVLLRIYSIDERPDIDRIKRYKLLPEHRKQTLARYMGYDALEQLSLSDLLVLFQRKWERIEAQTRTGDSPPTRRVFYQGFRLPRTALDDAVLHVSPNRKAAFNVVGPCSLRVVSAQHQPLSPMWLDGLSTNGAGLGEQALVWKDGASQRVEVPDGTWSLFLDNRSAKANDVRIAFERAPSQTVGQARLSTDSTLRWQAFLIPERIEMEGAIPAREKPVKFSTLSFVPNQMLVLELRAVLDGPEVEKPTRVQVTYFDKQGKAIRVFDNELVPLASRFEWASGPNDEETWVSEPVDILVVPPPGTRSVGLSADTRVIARGFVETEIEPPPSDAYPIAELPAVWKLRQVPRPGWARVDPIDRGELAAEQRLIKVVGQTRLERIDEKDRATVSWRSATAKGGAHEELLLAEVLPVEDEDLVSDNRALRLSCAPGKKVSASLLPDPAGDSQGILDITYYVPPSLELGGLIEVVQEGRSVAKIVPRTRFDGMRVRKVRRNGELLWNHGFSGGDPKTFVRISPGRGKPYLPPAFCKAFRTFTVTRIPPNGSVSVVVEANPEDPRPVNVVIYGTQTTTLAAIIDQGRLRRGTEPRVGRPTRAVQEIPLVFRPGASASFLLTRPDVPLRTAMTAFVSIGSDLSKGAHTLTLRNGGKSELWFRAFQSTGIPQKKAAVEVKRLQ